MTDIIQELRSEFVDDPDGAFTGLSTNELAIDGLTGFYQRKVWEKECSHLLAHARRNNEKVALIFVDLNNLKKVNDNEVWGNHALGDSYIKSVSEVLMNSLRSEDIIGRIGGDEFAVLLPNVDNSNVEMLINRLKKGVDESLGNNSKFKNVPNNILGLSVGLSFWDGKESLNELVARTDTEMYKDKRETKAIKTRPTKTYVAE